MFNTQSKLHPCLLLLTDTRNPFILVHAFLQSYLSVKMVKSYLLSAIYGNSDLTRYLFNEIRLQRGDFGSQLTRMLCGRKVLFFFGSGNSNGPLCCVSEGWGCLQAALQNFFYQHYQACSLVFLCPSYCCSNVRTGLRITQSQDQ